MRGKQGVRERNLKVRVETKRSRGGRCRGRARETAGRTGRRQVKLSERNMGIGTERMKKKGKRKD